MFLVSDSGHTLFTSSNTHCKCSSSGRLERPYPKRLLGCSWIGHLFSFSITAQSLVDSLYGFHQTLKNEEVYWKLYEHPQLARELLAALKKRYNSRCPRWALIPESGGDPLVSREVYVQGDSIQIPKCQIWAKVNQVKLETLLTEETV